MRIKTVWNRKGGVGKTTTSAMIATMLTLVGENVLVINNDPQHAGVSSVMGYTGHQGLTLADVLLGKATLQEVMLQTYIDEETMQYIDMTDDDNVAYTKEHGRPGPMLVTIDNRAAKIDAEMMNDKLGQWPYKLKKALATIKGIDTVIIDCGASFGSLTVNALCVPDCKVIVPVLPERIIAEGLAEIIANIAEIKDADMNESLELSAAFFSMVEKGWAGHRDVIDGLREPAVLEAMGAALGEKPLTILETVAYHNATIANSTNRRSVVVLDRPNTQQAKNYWFLLNELLTLTDPGSDTQQKVREVVQHIQSED